MPRLINRKLFFLVGVDRDLKSADETNNTGRMLRTTRRLRATWTHHSGNPT
jgi:hypothetical protein